MVDTEGPLEVAIQYKGWGEDGKIDQVVVDGLGVVVVWQSTSVTGCVTDLVSRLGEYLSLITG